MCLSFLSLFLPVFFRNSTEGLRAMMHADSGRSLSQREQSVDSVRNQTTTVMESLSLRRSPHSSLPRLTEATFDVWKGLAHFRQLSCASYKRSAAVAFDYPSDHYDSVANTSTVDPQRRRMGRSAVNGVLGARPQGSLLPLSPSQLALRAGSELDSRCSHC